MWKFLLKLVINGIAIWAAAELVPGMALDTGQLLPLIIVVLVFGLTNTLLKPLLVILGLPFIILSLGLFLIVINGLLLGVTAALTNALSLTGGFTTAILGSLVVSIVSWFLESVVLDED